MSTLTPSVVALSTNTNGLHVVDHCVKHFSSEDTKKCFDIIDTEEDDIYQAWRFRAAKRLRGMLHAIRKKGAHPYWIPPEVLSELMRRWNADAYRQLQARNTAARKLTRGTSLHTAGGTTFPEARLRLNHSLGRQSHMDEFFEHTHTRKEDRTQWVDENSRKTKVTYLY
ncbi:uncharacterized protein LOC107615755 [Arachis ipaensis]|uniref:uncharacterized protein LOC107615755 n=1 Tax=Arachis ipaensis TaxID=130454 RepID=UPI000A2B351D|nr:uncharacterized protein LOC107615755 [Arachis ipaensis]